MGLFPPGKGGGDDVEYGFKGKGITQHLLTDGFGMPLTIITTSAAESERAQVINLMAQVRIFGPNRKQPRGPKPEGPKDRWKVERCFAWMQKKIRRLCIKWERCRTYWNGFIALAISWMWLTKLLA
jgi:hypothetical protein